MAGGYHIEQHRYRIFPASQKVHCIFIYWVTSPSISSKRVYCVLLVALVAVKFTFTVEVADTAVWATYLCNLLVTSVPVLQILMYYFHLTIDR